MKKKREKLFCDKFVDDNRSWIDQLGKVADSDAVVDVVYPYMLKKVADSGIDLAKVSEIAQKSLLADENAEQFTKILCINNFFWSGRQVYKFDDTLSELLASQSRSGLQISVESLKKLPVDSFYIVRKSQRNPKSYGFFFSLSADMMYIADLTDDETSKDMAYTVRLAEGVNISEILGEDYAAEYGNESRVKVAPLIKRMSSEIVEYMQFVIYLCAVNAEVVPATSHAVVTRQAGQRKYESRSKSEMSEVGYRIGAVVRKSQEEREKVVYVGEHSKGTKKSPHIRRSHFHSFWTGSGEEKKLVVKWIDTIFVHGDDGETPDDSTVHKVE